MEEVWDHRKKKRPSVRRLARPGARPLFSWGSRRRAESVCRALGRCSAPLSSRRWASFQVINEGDGVPYNAPPPFPHPASSAYTYICALRMLNTLCRAACATSKTDDDNDDDDQNNRWAPVNELVLLQVLAALGDVPGHVEKIHHGQTGRMLLFTWRQSLILATASACEEERATRGKSSRVCLSLLF